MEDILIRSAKVSDAEALLNIYSYYVLNTAVSFEYEAPTLLDFKGRIENTLKRFPYIVAERNGRILGYCYAGAFHSRAAYSRCAELSIYLDKDERKRGIGRRLYEDMEKRLKDMGFLNFYACIAYPVTEDKYLSLDSVRFHEKMGYEIIGEFHRCGYKFDTWYNVVWMEKLV